MQIKKLEKFLNMLLEVDRFTDYCPNGLQVEAKSDTNKIVLGVSASMALFEKAKQMHVSTVIVHHGLFWKGQNYALKGVMGARVKFLFNNNINLLAYHLPLDCHYEIGNNACIANSIGLIKRSSFGKHGGVEIGIAGELRRPETLSKIENKVKKFFGQIRESYSFGKKSIKKIAIVSGGAAEDVYEAQALGADLFITGEAKEPIQEWCREVKMNFIAAGHYASEQSGIKALGKIIEKEFNIPCKFVSVSNKV